MNWNPTLRRHFLQGAGKTALVLPFLSSLLSRKAEAQAVSSPKQKSFIGIPMWNHIKWQYNVSEAESRTNPSEYMPAYLNMKTVAGAGKHVLHTKSLIDAKNDNPQGRISEIIDASWNAMLPKMQMLQGFDYLPMWGHTSAQFGNHHAVADAGIAGQNPAVVNIDQVMAHSTNFYKNPALKGKYVHWTGASTDIDYGGHYLHNTFTYSDPTKQATSPVVSTPAIDKPSVLWDKFFAQFTPPPPGSTGADRRKTLVDRVILDYRDVLNGTRLGADDRKRVERHVQLLQDTQKTVVAVASCTKPNRPAATVGIKATLEAHNNVITALIACGLCHSFLARIQTFAKEGDSDAWHRWSHEAASYDLTKQQMHGVAGVGLDLATKLDAQGLLDDSLIALPMEHGRIGHIGIGSSVITIGSAGGVFNTGQYLDYRDFTSRTGDLGYLSGYPFNQLWANWLMAVGVPASEFEPLNKTTNSVFSPANSGYGSNVYTFANNYLEVPYGYNTRFKGHNMSDWLPLIKV